MPNPIIIRDDDVLLLGSKSDALERFKRIHSLVCQSPRLLHVPAILTQDIQQFSGAIEYVREETEAGRMAPQLHGLQHIDYGNMDPDKVKAEIALAVDQFQTMFGFKPTKWYTPWGANQPHLHETAKFLGMEAVDCSNVIKFKGRYGVKQLLEDGLPLTHFEGREIIMHWWNGLDVERLALLVEKLNNEVRFNH